MRKRADVTLAFALFLPRWCCSEAKMGPSQSRVGEGRVNIMKIYPVPILMPQVE